MTEEQRKQMQEDVKGIIEGITEHLKKRGISIEHIASGVFRPKKENKETSSRKTRVYENEQEEVFNGECKEGLTFDNFEEQLNEPGCVFDYHSMILAGKEFQVKYFLSGNKQIEQLVVAPASQLRKTSDELLEDLDQAFAKNDRHLASQIIAEIKKRII